MRGGLVLVVLVCLGLSVDGLVGTRSAHRRSATLSKGGRKSSSSSSLSLRDDDEDRPLLEFKEDMKTMVTIKSLDEVIPQKKASAFSSKEEGAKEEKMKEAPKKKMGTKTFGSLSIEDLNADVYVSPTGANHDCLANHDDQTTK